MDISPVTVQALDMLSRQDSTLLSSLYQADSLEQAADIIVTAAQRLSIAIDRCELTHFLQSAGRPDFLAG